MRLFKVLFAFMFCCALCIPAAAEAAFPQKTMQMIVPYSAGGGTDIMARAVAQFLEGALGQKVIVVNKPGASGQIGTAEVAESKPDGYTMIMLSSTDFLLAPLMVKDPGFAIKDFTQIASFNDSANCIIVKKDSPFKTLGELIEFAKKNPNKVTVSTSGDAHVFLAAMIASMTGAELSPVKYSGAGENLNAILGGHVDAALIDKRFAKQAEQGGAKVLGVASEERYAMLPDVPTFVEQGFPIIDSQRRVLAVPAKTPKDVVEALTKAVLSFGETPEFTDKLTALSEVRLILTGEKLRAIMDRQAADFAKVVASQSARLTSK